VKASSGSFERGNETSVSTTDKEFLTRCATGNSLRITLQSGLFRTPNLTYKPVFALENYFFSGV